MIAPLYLVFAAVGTTLISGAVAMWADRDARVLRFVAFPLLGLAGVLAVLGGGWALVRPVTLTYQGLGGLPWLPWHVRLDPLSGFFEAVVGLVLVPVALFAPGYVREFERNRQPLAALGLFTALFVTGMLLVPLADDAFLFMIAWEVMSLSSYFLVAYQHEHRPNRRAAFLYLLMAHVGALVILLSFSVLAGFGNGFAFDVMRATALSPAWATIAFLLALAGFGMKAGVVPLHAWLPEAHPVAPSHISALMSGVMLKVAVYGFIRFTFDLLGDVQWQWGVIVLVVGCASALLGVLYALMQHDLKRLLAYHSVENIGIIYMGIGLSLIYAGSGHLSVGALGLIAALYHTVNHALFKSLLFLGAGAIIFRTHERDLNHMGGLIRRMPATALYFLVGCIAIAGLPPLNGFVSEWLTFQTALQVPALTSGVLRAVIPVAAAVLALTGALAAACFVKVYGAVFLGRARSRHLAHGHRSETVRGGMRWGQALLALQCVLLGVLPTPMVQTLEAVPRLVLGAALPEGSAHGWMWLTPVAPAVASYSAPLVLAFIGAVCGIAFVLLRPHRLTVRRAYPWECGFGTLTARMQYTATAFAMPIRRIFLPVWRVEESVETERRAGAAAPTTAIRYHLHIEDRSWNLFYAPLARAVHVAARWVAYLQTGNVRAYLAYSFFTLILMLWVVS